MAERTKWNVLSKRAMAGGMSAVIMLTVQTTRAEGPCEDCDAGYTKEFFMESGKYVSEGRNLFFSLEPGYQLILNGVNEDGKFEELTVTVLRETKDIRLPIDGHMRTIRTRIIEERSTLDGVLEEISRNYYARRLPTNDVFYFGEDVCFYENDECVDTRGSWLAGVDGAEPGIIMPGTFLLGARYYQEIAPDIALDRAENVMMGLEVDVPAGEMEDCAVVHETSPIDAGAESTKVFAPGVGFVKEGGLELVWYGYRQ